MADLTVPSAAPLSAMHGVELVQAGQWNISTGMVTFSRDDLAAAVGAIDCPAVRRPVLKLGHSEPDPDEHGMRWDGEPAVGWIDNMALADSGNTVVGDYVGMPGWLGDILPSAYPDRSIEAYFDWPCQLGHTHPFVITAVALLGVVPPGVGTLRSLQDVASLYQVAAEATIGQPVVVTIHASKGVVMPNPRPAQVAAGVSSEDVRRAYYEHAPWQEWICEIQLSPLQLIVVDDTSGSYYRVPVQVDGEDAFSFGDKVEVKIRYEDVPADTPAAAASALVFASRAESRPGTLTGRLAAATVSDTAWSDFTQADYDVTQWHTACLVHTHDGDPESKSDCKLPVREPSGTLNRNAIHAAAGRISQLEDVPADDVTKAAKQLVALYRDELDEDPPEALLELAGETVSAAAAAPETPPVEPAAGPTPTPEGEAATMPTLDEGLRERLGLDADADEATILEKLDETLAELTAPTVPDPTPVPVAAAPALPEGTVAIDEATLAELREQASQGVAARARQLGEDRDRAIDDAIKAGKTMPARRDHWQTAWAADPDGTRQMLASLAPGLVPLEDVGEPGGEPANADADTELDHLFSRKAG